MDRADKNIVVVQVVDARNPMLYRCEALENYVRSVGAWKGNVILCSRARHRHTAPARKLCLFGRSLLESIEQQNCHDLCTGTMTPECRNFH